MLWHGTGAFLHVVVPNLHINLPGVACCTCCLYIYGCHAFPHNLVLAIYSLIRTRKRTHLHSNIYYLVYYPSAHPSSFICCIPRSCARLFYPGPSHHSPAPPRVRPPGTERHHEAGLLIVGQVAVQPFSHAVTPSNPFLQRLQSASA
ncbi:hypothetical protein GGI43DRAFT_352769 [Trichoderma evansii]